MTFNFFKISIRILAARKNKVEEISTDYQKSKIGSGILVACRQLDTRDLSRDDWINEFIKRK